MGVTVKRRVRVKVVVTEEFKARRAAEIRAALAGLDNVRKRISFELDSAAKREDAGSTSNAAMLERLAAGRRDNERVTAALKAELDKLSSLEVGDEYERGVLDGWVEVEVGDHLSKIGLCEIVVKDDVIVEIRNGQCPELTEISS
jgi:hypothetical protein